MALAGGCLHCMTQLQRVLQREIETSQQQANPLAEFFGALHLRQKQSLPEPQNASSDDLQQIICSICQCSMKLLVPQDCFRA